MYNLNVLLHFQVMVQEVLGLESVCLVISVMGFARIIATWVSVHSSDICPSYLVIGKSTNNEWIFFLKWREGFKTGLVTS